MVGMTGKTRWMTGAVLSAALMLGSISAAEARPRYDRGYDRGHHQGWGHYRRGGDGFGFGDALGVAALVGAVAIVASSVSKNKQAAQNGDDVRDGDTPPPADGTDYGTDVRSGVPSDGARTDAGDFSDIANANGRDDAMTDACAVAARDEAQRQEGAQRSGYAEIRRMDMPRAVQTGGYNIDGEVETRASWRAASGETRRFTCAVQADGRVADVYLSRDLVMQ